MPLHRVRVINRRMEGAPMTTIVTDRLTLRPFTEEDIPDYAEIRRMPGVTRFLPSHTDDVQESDRRAAAIVWAFAALWTSPGYGPWAVEHAGTLIGHAGLRFVAEMDATEVLFLLNPAHQGKGIATEAAGVALRFGFETLGLDDIVAWAMPQNHASLAVMQRIGMNRMPDLVTVSGVQAVETRITAQQFARTFSNPV